MPAERQRLLVLPHAGAGASAYRSWPELAPATLEVRVVRLPGREDRWREPLRTDAVALAAELAEPLLADRAPLALFGHSLGALLAFELARALTARGRPPTHLFASAFAAPHLPRTPRARHLLPDPAFDAELARIGGTVPEVLADAELMSLLRPIIRADFALCETHTHSPGPPLPCPITALGGLADPSVDEAALTAWASLGTGFALHRFAGDHFFPLTAAPAVLTTIARALT